MTPPEEAQEITLRLPGRPEYLLVARLAISGVATRMDFPAEAVEDIKLAISEACTYLLERIGSLEPSPELVVRCTLQSEALSIEVSAEVPTGQTASPQAETAELTGLGMLIMQCVMDEVELVQATPSLRIRMVKRRLTPS